MTHIGTILKELGADYDDVCKVIAVYEGECGGNDLHKNLSIRSSFFRDPGRRRPAFPCRSWPIPGWSSKSTYLP